MRLALGILTICAALLPGSGNVVAGSYTEHNACPVEACRFGKWSVQRDTVLYKAPRGTEKVGTARAGEWVESMTGTLYTQEIRVEVVHRIELEGEDPYVTESWGVVRKLRVGDVFYILGQEGEGFSKIELRGRYESLDLYPLIERDEGTTRYFRSCDDPSPKCWWRIPEGNRVQKSEWWVKIRLPDGIVGWTREINFGDISCIDAEIDPCG